MGLKKLMKYFSKEQRNLTTEAIKQYKNASLTKLATSYITLSTIVASGFAAIEELYFLATGFAILTIVGVCGHIEYSRTQEKIISAVDRLYQMTLTDTIIEQLSGEPVVLEEILTKDDIENIIKDSSSPKDYV